MFIISILRSLVVSSSLLLSFQVLGNFSDGETYQLASLADHTIYYYLKKPQSDGVPLLLFLQGSQAESASNHPLVDLVWKRLDSKIGLLVVEKPGLRPRVTGCDPSYLRENSLEQRLSDIKVILDKSKEFSWWNGEILILGGSEGGALGAMITEVFLVSKAVLLVTGGGMTMAEAIPTMIRSSMAGSPASNIENALEQIFSVFSKVRANPHSRTDAWGGCYSYNYWHKILWYRPVDSMLSTTSKYLLVHGDRDTDHPIESARITAKKFKMAHDQRLTFLEKKGLDHVFENDLGESFMEPIVEMAIDWLMET